MMFEAVLGIDSNLLMRMQLNYIMRVVKQNKTFTMRLSEIRKAVAF